MVFVETSFKSIQFYYYFLESPRSLYSKASLGIDGFLESKAITEKQMENISVKFKEKMEEYCQDINTNVIFSEDLKNMVHLANNNNDSQVIIKMIKKYLHYYIA